MHDGIEGETKSAPSVRDVDIPASLRRSLLEHKLASPFKLDDHFVFSAQVPIDAPAVSRPIDPRNLYHRELKRALKRAEIAKATGLHDLRHGYASALLAAGVNIARVSALLGHGSPAITLSTYAHLMPSHRDDAAERLDALLSGSTDQSCNRSVTSVASALSAESQVAD